MRISALIQLNIDNLVSLLLFGCGLYAYTATLAPTVIEGDAALFQYTPYVLGVTYPTGFPLYILLGKVWVTLFPFGEIAWRMNLFSALCSALALPLIYNAVRRFFMPSLAGGRWAALATVLTFATMPTFWRWSTEAKTYGLNILLFSSILYTLALGKDSAGRSAGVAAKGHRTISPSSRSFMTARQSLRFSLEDRAKRWGNLFLNWNAKRPLALPFVLMGLFISVHNTAVLLIPGLLAMAWLHYPDRFRRLKAILGHLLLLGIPGLFYLYIPIRAEWLLTLYTRQEAIERGLLADFYHSGLRELVNYFTGVGFTEGVVSNWSLVPAQFFSVYLPLLIEDLTLLGVALGLIGGLLLALTQIRLFLPLFMWYAVPILFVIVYGQGEQSAFLLPSFLIFSFFVGFAIISAAQLVTQLAYLISSCRQRSAQQSPPSSKASHFTLYIVRFTPPLLLAILLPLLFLPQIQHNVTWLSIKWNRDIYNEWADALNHPLESNAGMLAHWGDLTSFWYMQHADGRRPDLHGVYPPDEATVVKWYEQGNNDLYIAGPLQGWAADIEDRYQFIPWGRLVRIVPQQIDPALMLPPLSQPVGATFGNFLHLIGADYAPQATAGLDYPITLTWQTLAELPPEATVSIRLSQDGIIVTQLDERLRSGWFPRDILPAGQHILSYTLLPVPLGTLPGEYQLQLVAYTNVNQPWSLSEGKILLDLGSVEIVPLPANQTPDISQFKPLASHDFNNEIELVGYSYSVRRVGQGKGFALRLLWQAKSRPQDNYTLLVEQVNAAGTLLRSIEHQPVGSRAPTGSWQAGQFIRDQVDLVAPAGAPPGQDILRVRLSWLRPDGSKLKLRRWSIPLSDSLNLGWLHVTEKKERIFEVPPIQHSLNANLDNKVRLLGYTVMQPSETALQSSAGFHFGQIDQSDCATINNACKIDVEFYWQGLAEMEQLYRVFLHVVDGQGKITAQHDRVPGERGQHPTTGWLPGEVVVDPIELSLPSDIIAGQYTVRIGLYLPPDGPRLSVLDETGRPGTDFVDVGNLEITKP